MVLFKSFFGIFVDGLLVKYFVFVSSFNSLGLITGTPSGRLPALEGALDN